MVVTTLTPECPLIRIAVSEGAAVLRGSARSAATLVCSNRGLDPPRRRGGDRRPPG